MENFPTYNFFRAFLLSLCICGNFFFCAAQTSSPKKDSAYYVQFVDNETREGIPFANVYAKSDTVHIGSWTTDLDGIIKIKANQINRKDANIKFTAMYVGYEKLSFTPDFLRMNDTIIMQMKSDVLQFETMEIIEYKVPLIVPDTPEPKFSDRFKKKKKIVEPPKPASIYSQQQLDQYDSLKNGTFFANDTIKNRGVLPAEQWFPLFARRLKYPEVDRDNDIEGIVYFDFTLDEDGNIKNIVWRAGSSPAASLEVARVLRNMPGLVNENYVNEEVPATSSYKPYIRIIKKPITCRIAVRFKLE